MLTTDEQTRALAEPARAGGAGRRPAAVLTALFCAVWGYMSLRAAGLERSAPCFLGLPAAMAMVVSTLAPGRRAVWTTLAAVTCGFLVAGPVFNESATSLVLVAPLACTVALVVALCSGSSRGRAVVTLVLLVLCAEGVFVAVPRESSASVTRTVDAGTREVERLLAGPPVFPPRPPLLLRLGFPLPRPSVAPDSGWSGRALVLGDEKTVRFGSREPLGLGVQRERRVMRLRVVEREERRVVFKVVRDTALHHWVNLRYAEVTWRAAAAGRTEVVWRLRYERTFDPAWYFGPLQGYGMEQAAGYLADAFRP